MKIKKSDSGRVITIKLNKKEHDDIISCIYCHFKECDSCERNNIKSSFVNLKNDDKYYMAGIKYLECYLSNELPTIEEVAKKFHKYPSGVKCCIKTVLKKYGNIELDYGQRIDSVSVKEMRRILEKAKEMEAVK